MDTVLATEVTGLLLLEKKSESVSAPPGGAGAGLIGLGGPVLPPFWPRPGVLVGGADGLESGTVGRGGGFLTKP